MELFAYHSLALYILVTALCYTSQESLKKFRCVRLAIVAWQLARVHKTGYSNYDTPTIYCIVYQQLCYYTALSVYFGKACGVLVWGYTCTRLVAHGCLIYSWFHLRSNIACLRVAVRGTFSRQRSPRTHTECVIAACPSILCLSVKIFVEATHRHTQARNVVCVCVCVYVHQVGLNVILSTCARYILQRKYRLRTAKTFSFKSIGDKAILTVCSVRHLFRHRPQH